MSYKLEKPTSIKERADFIVQYNHNRGLRIEDSELDLYALEPWEELSESGEVVDNKEIYEAEQAQKDVERIANLKLTKREVFLALYNDSGITPEQIKNGLTNPLALIEFEYANEYYRGNPLIDLIGTSLGYSKEQLDYLFENKSFPVKNGISGGDENA